MLNGKTEIIISSYRGEFAYQGRGSFPAHGIAKIYSDGIADIFINFRIESFIAGSDTEYNIFSYDFLKKLCQNREVIWDSYNTIVHAYSAETPIPTSYLGRSGLIIEIGNTKAIKLARLFGNSMNSGGWGASNAELYQKGAYYIINIYGATLS